MLRAQGGNTLSRAQLLGGIAATGTLAACTGGSNALAPRAGTTCAAVALTTDAASTIFADPFFNCVDKKAVVDRVDVSPKLDQLHQTYFAPRTPQVQSGTGIQQIPGEGIVIRTPGTYRFTGDMAWTPNPAGKAAITIVCGDVTLDLAGFTLTASGADKTQKLAGILVLGPVGNVTITNGTVANCPEYGVLASQVCGLEVSRMTVTGICLQNIAIRYLTPAGIHVTKSQNVTVRDCVVSQLDVTADSCAGIQLMATTSAKVSNCRVQGLINRDGAVQGFSLIQCTYVATSGCTAQSLQSFFGSNLLTSGHTVLGFCPILCMNLSYVDCSAIGMTGCCDDCHAMSVFLDAYVSVVRFRADQVIDGVGPTNTGAKATGLEVYGVGITVIDSVVSNITAINPQDKQAAGFSVWGAFNQFLGCTATNVTAIDATGTSRGSGFAWAPDPRPEFRCIGALAISYIDCVADHCQVGFDTWFHVDSSWTRPIHTNCQVDILVEPGATRTLSCDGCSECITPFSVTLKNFASGNTFKP